MMLDFCWSFCPVELYLHALQLFSCFVCASKRLAGGFGSRFGRSAVFRELFGVRKKLWRTGYVFAEGLRNNKSLSAVSVSHTSYRQHLVHTSSVW